MTFQNVDKSLQSKNDSYWKFGISMNITVKYIFRYLICLTLDHTVRTNLAINIV